MDIDEMISQLDTAAGMLLGVSMKNPIVRMAMEKIANVSIALGELGEKLEED